jgi:hypothetical protein
MAQNPSDTLPVISADPEDHLKAVAKLVSDEFADGQYLDEIARKYYAECHFDWNTSRLAFDGDEVVHHWGVWGYPMRLGPVELMAAGVGAVVTREPYRNRGLMHRAANSSFKAMRANGYDVSVLRGRHYHKYGYRRAWNYDTWRIKADDVSPPEDPVETQPLGPDHMDEIVELYNQTHAGLSGTAIRPTYPMLEEGEMNVHGWFDEGGQLTGYVRASENEEDGSLRCLEAAGDPDIGLSILAQMFHAGEYDTLTFFTVPLEHPILQRVRLGMVKLESQYFYHTGWQVKLINLQLVLAKSKPLLEERLQHSRFHAWKGRLELDGGEEQAGLVCRKGEVVVDAFDPDGENKIEAGPGLGRLLIGSDGPKEIMRQEGMACHGMGEELGRILFPSMHPMLSHWDEY